MKDFKTPQLRVVGQFEVEAALRRHLVRQPTDLEFVHVSCGAGLGESTLRESKIGDGNLAFPREVKNEGTSGDVHENKWQMTICPAQNTAFVPGCTPFYTETHEFCGDRRLFATIRALWNELLASKWRNLRRRFCASTWRDQPAATASDRRCRLRAKSVAHENRTVKPGGETWKPPRNPECL
jgi:hypothetical protein